MRFNDPSILWWLLIVPVMAALLHVFFQRKLHKAQDFIASSLWSQGQLEAYLLRERLLAVCLLGFLFVTIIAIARPQWGESDEVVKRRGMDIFVAVDVSKSMLTRDIRPSRLERTQWAIKDLVKKLNGDRIGLIAFAGEAFVMCPLTIDYNGFLTSVDDLSPAVIPRGGTNISTAIAEALKNSAASTNHYQALVLVTDGEELEGDVLMQARQAKEKGIKIFTVGVGSQEGDLIQVTDNNGSREFVKDAEGNVVKSRLNERLLQSIAYETGGAYVRSSPSEFGLDFLYEKQLSLIPKQDGESKQSRQMVERYQWSLTIGLMFLLASLLVIDKRIALLLLCGVCVLASPSDVFAKDMRQLVNEGNLLYRKGNFEKAAAVYQEAQQINKDSAIVQYNLGTALYKNKDFNQAINSLEEATHAKDIKVQQPAFYNLGNAQLKSGLGHEDEDIDQAVKQVEQSIASYDQAVLLDNKDQLALQNKKKAQDELKRLKEKKKDQQQQSDKSKDSKENKDKQDNEKKQDQQNKQQSKTSEQDKDTKDSAEKEQQPSKQQQQSNKQDQDNKKQGQEKEQQAKPESAQEKEAKEILSDYQRNEEPKGMLYLIDKKSSEQAVTKDW